MALGNKAFATTAVSTDFKARHEFQITIHDGSRSVLLLLFVHVKVCVLQSLETDSLIL